MQQSHGCSIQIGSSTYQQAKRLTRFHKRASFQFPIPNKPQPTEGTHGFHSRPSNPLSSFRDKRDKHCWQPSPPPHGIQKADCFLPVILRSCANV